MKFRPTKWILYAPVAVLPFLAAFALTGKGVLEDVAVRAQKALLENGGEWAKLTFDGRDAAIAGDAGSTEAVDAAVKAVAGTYGVRLVSNGARVVLAPLAAPTVDPANAQSGKVVVTGTWPEGEAAMLKASLAGTTWMLGTGTALSSDGKGKWTLIPDIELKPGTYDLTVVASDAAGRTAVDTSKDEITVTPPPLPEMKPPAVESVEVNSATPEIHGTWPSAVAKTLSVTVGQTAYVLNTDKELAAAGENWTLKPSGPLPDGTAEVTAEVSDGTGRVVKSVSPGKITIDTKAPAAPVIDPVTPGGLPLAVTGNWPEGDAVSLVARLAGRVWTYGVDKSLSSDGAGRWSFTPAIELQPGTYDLEIEVADKLGNISRDSTRDEIVIAAPPPQPSAPRMTAPTVAAAAGTVARPVIKGTWSEIAAKSLSVAVGGTAYVLGTDEALTSDGIGNWSLALANPLEDGVYDVAVESRDAAGIAMTDSSKNEITIDARGPDTPTVALYAGEASPGKISGTWDWEHAHSLKVSIPAAGIGSTLGANQGLTSGAGIWTLALAAKLAPGSYDVVAETADEQGRIARDQTRFEILVKAPAPAPAPPPPAAELKIPTITNYAGESSPKSVSGTWDEGAATILKVGIAGAKIAAVLGTEPALTTDGKGNWTLALANPLEPGVYDVDVETSAADGRTASDTSTAEIYITAPPPPPPPPPVPPPPLPPLKPPTVTAYSGEGSPSAILGTWAEGPASALKVSIPAAGISATLDKDAALATDGSGNWSLALAKPLDPGNYDVVVETSSPDGRTATDATAAELEIKAAAPPPPPPPPPPPAPPPYDCEGVLAEIVAANPILFAFDHVELEPPYDQVIGKVAALLDDERCHDRKAEVTGHADYFGGRLYNTALSEARAQVVVNALVAAGMEPNRLTVTGKGKSEPSDAEHTRVARTKNRRVVISIVK